MRSASTRRIGRRGIAAGMALGLAGCAGLFVASAPGKLYRLPPADNFSAGLPRSSALLVIDRPQAPAGIDTDRIALSASPLTLDYFAQSEWTDRLPDLMQSLLLASFENSGAITAIDRNTGGLRADYVLRTEIRHFEAVYETQNAPPRIRVALIVRLESVRERAILTERRFEARVPAAANDVPAIVAAFAAATDAVLREIVEWTLSNPSLTRPPPRLL
jgi:cholesterol transport system auxiliary component